MKNYINNTGDEKINWVMKTTIPVYKREHNLPALIANGFILCINDLFFFITAGHVFRENDTFYLPKDEGDFFPHGELNYLHTKDIEPGTDYDQCDLALLKLENDTEEIINSFYCISIGDILFDHIVQRDSIYLLYGYPFRKYSVNTTNRDSLANALYYHVRRHPSENIFNKTGHNHQVNIPLEYRKKTVLNGTQTGFTPEPDGVSGSGLWILTKINGAEKYMIVGLFIEYHRFLSLGIATKVQPLISKVMELYNLKVDITGYKDA